MKKNKTCLYLVSLIAFATTINELADIPSAAIQGWIKPIAANGKAVILYANAQPRFCLIMRIIFLATVIPR